MTKQKYSLSKSGMDKLMKRLENIAQENLAEVDTDDDSIQGLSEAEITTDFVKALTKVKDMDDVKQRNEQLTKSFSGLLDMYGFRSMYDMYIYAKSCDIVPEELRKSGSKSPMVPVTRQITRNGKGLEVNIWINTAEFLSKKIDKKNSPTNDLNISVTELNEGKYHMEITDDNGESIGSAEYATNGNYLTMSSYKRNITVPGVATRGFFELVGLAHRKGKGVKMKDNLAARHVFTQSGLERYEDDMWYIEPDRLKELLGGSGE